MSRVTRYVSHSKINYNNLLKELRQNYRTRHSKDDLSDLIKYTGCNLIETQEIKPSKNYQRKYDQYIVEKVYATGSITNCLHKSNPSDYKEMLEVYNKAKINKSNLVSSIRFVGVRSNGDRKIFFEKTQTLETKIKAHVINRVKIEPDINHSEQIQTNKQNEDMKIDNMIENLIDISESLNEEHKLAVNQEAEINERQFIVLHEIESVDEVSLDINNETKLKLFNELKEIRMKRREIKNRRSKLEYLIQKQNLLGIGQSMKQYERNKQLNTKKAVQKYEKLLSEEI